MTEERAIQPISKEVAHRICTGQVVASLAGACKELIDNALDAGARSIDIRLKGYGCDVLEVSDNGCGVGKDNFPALCKPHQTSKLRDIDDLSRLNTYGFRGEALNALCALSNVTITTRTAGDQIATRMTFDHRGETTAVEKCSRQPGMTVSVQNLFEPLPVRRKELVNTAKKEYCKLLAMVQSYAIVAVNVRFSCTSMIAEKKVAVLSTNGNHSMTDNICNVFGPKQVVSLQAICHTMPSEQLCHDFGIKDATVFDNFKLCGFISSAEHGQGRSSTDRQFVFINQRPVEFPKVTKIVNDVYHQFNRTQVPLVALCIAMPPNFVDVNLSPDKRQVFVTYEKELFALVKSSLLATFDLVASKCPTVPSSAPKFSSASTVMSSSFMPERNGASSANAQAVHSKNATPNKSTTTTVTVEAQTHLAAIKQTDGGQAGKNLKRSREGTSSSSSSEQKKQSCLEAFNFGAKRSSTSDNATVQAAAIDVARAEADMFAKSAAVNGSRCESPSPPVDSSRLRGIVQRTTVSNLFGLPPGLDVDVEMDEGRSSVSRESAMDSRPSSALTPPAMSANATSGLSSTAMNEVRLKVEEASQSQAPVDKEFNEPQPSTSAHPTRVPGGQVGVSLPKREGSVKVWRIEEDLPMSMEKLWARLAQTKPKPTDPVPEPSDTFSSQLKADENKTAEAELTRYFLKSDFERMDVIGQFNRGFILARLHDDLFIVDQHASDEKFNFETLQKNARIKTQKLLQPLALELGAIQEMVVQDNVEIFKQNGFEFLFDGNADPGKRVKLTAVPAIHDWNFDKNDVEEMVAVLSDFSGIMYRPSRLRKLFASKACRKSVMIGTALNKSQMTRIVQHLAKLENPWTCPHGRPTLRHLRNL